MEYRRLGNSGLIVSAIGLGTNTFGSRADEPAAAAIVDSAIELGINFFDTADIYNQGRSEEILGRAVKGRRSRVLIGTKFGFPTRVPPGESGGSRSYIIKAVETSLKRLGSDYIDLYYLHHPDSETPMAETLGALDDLVRAGKVRYIGCSNFAAWQLGEAIWTARCHHFEPFVAIQSRYNMLDRSIEREVVPCCQAYGVGIIPWKPLAGGFLTGKYRPGQGIAPGTALADSSVDILTSANFAKLDRLEEFARECRHTVGELAIAYLLAHPWVGSVIAGATRKEQLMANAAAFEWKLSPDELAQLDKILV